MSADNTTIARAEEKTMQYVPFASKDPIKLSVNIVKDMVSARTRTGRVCSDEDAIKFMMLCKARGLNPFEGDAFLVGYDNKDGSATFSLITAHQAFLKRAEPHPEYDGMESGVIVRDAVGEVIDRPGDFTFDDDVILGGWATVHFKNRKFPMKKRLKLSTFAKDNNFWRSNPAGMICKCAEADALRSAFPTILGGMYSAEEMAPPVEFVSMPAAKTARKQMSVAEKIEGAANGNAEKTNNPPPTENKTTPETNKPPENANGGELPAPVTPPLQQPTGTLFKEPDLNYTAKSNAPQGPAGKPGPDGTQPPPDEAWMADLEETLRQQIEGVDSKAKLAGVGAKMKDRAAQFGKPWVPFGDRLDVAYKAKFRSLSK